MDLAPSYEERVFDPEDRHGRFRLVAGRDGRDGALTVHQGVEAWMTSLDGDAEVRLDLRPQR